LYDTIIKYKNSINSFSDALAGICGKKVVMAIGATGVGKSTLMNAVVQGAENMELNEDCDVAAK